VVLTVLVAVLVALAGDPTPARPVAVTPADGSTLDTPPTEVSVVFSEGRGPRAVHLAVTDPTGAEIATASPGLTGRSAVVAVNLTAAGPYRLGYHAVLADGRETAGVSWFTVVAGSPAAAAPPSVPTSDGGHGHAGTDPLSVGLLILDALLVVAVAALLLRRRTTAR
jgi:methionine-rich copper-binding protein CopC